MRRRFKILSLSGNGGKKLPGKPKVNPFFCLSRLRALKIFACRLPESLALE